MSLSSNTAVRVQGACHACSAAHRLERKYHAAKGNKNWIYELAFHMDNLRFRVRGGADTKLYIAQILTQIGKL